MSLLSWSRVYGSGRHAHSTTSSDSPCSRNAPHKEDMMAGTLDRVVTSVATQLMLAPARTANAVSERVLAHLVGAVSRRTAAPTPPPPRGFGGMVLRPTTPSRCR